MSLLGEKDSGSSAAGKRKGFPVHTRKNGQNTIFLSDVEERAKVPAKLSVLASVLSSGTLGQCPGLAHHQAVCMECAFSARMEQHAGHTRGLSPETALSGGSRPCTGAPEEAWCPQNSRGITETVWGL